MLFFRSEEQAGEWCRAHHIPQRPIIPLPQLWQLAREWYHSRLTPEARRPVPAEMVEIFARIGLTGPFWDPRADSFS
jgi:Alkylmercury lyase